LGHITPGITKSIQVSKINPESNRNNEFEILFYMTRRTRKTKNDNSHQATATAAANAR
jgi:hypothetical protein